MPMSSKTVVSIRKALSSELAFRVLADRFFDYVEALDAKEIVIDFSGIKSISRSFAHQYILRKRKTQKKIAESNMPENVERMFEIVRQPKTETIFTEIEEVKQLQMA